MPRRQPYPFANPFSLWITLASKTNEMLLASSEVIAHRSQLMARAGAMPDASDQREMERMVNEKASAAIASASAISSQTGQIIATTSTRMLAQMAAGTSMFFDLAAGAASGRVGAAQSRAMRSLVNQSSHSANQISSAAAQIASAGIAPFHKRATSNARRLRKR